MPELPEVETVRRTLAPALGHRVVSLWTSGKPLRMERPVDGRALRHAAIGHRLIDVRRRGKYLLLDFDGGSRSVLVHLGMSGRLRLHRAGDPRAPHTHVVFGLAGRGPAELRFSDPRRFGMVDVVDRRREREHPALAVLGVDPLEEGIDGALLHRHAAGSTRTLKALLLDQGVIAGVGNIYASEALWVAGLHPSTRARRLGRRADALAAAVTQVLHRALDQGGTSLRDFVAADGREGDNSDYLQVYGRDGERCLRRGCSGQIRRTVHQGRATYYCPACQDR